MAAVNPEVSEAMALALRGDAIGSTMYSQRYILRILIKLTNLIRGQEEFNTEFETDLCTLWDMCAEKDVAVFVKRHGIISMCVNTLWVSANPRLTEIIVGIIGNLCSVRRVRKECRQRGDLVEIMMELLSFPDPPTLIQVMRILQTFAWEISNTFHPIYQEIANDDDDLKDFKDFQKDSSSQKKGRQLLVNPFYVQNRVGNDDKTIPEDLCNSIMSEISSVSDNDDIEILTDCGSDSDVQLIQEMNIDKTAVKCEEKCENEPTVKKESFIEDDDISLIEDSVVIRKKTNNQNGSEKVIRNAINLSRHASESPQNKTHSENHKDDISTAGNEAESDDDVIFEKMVVVLESDSLVEEDKDVTGSGDSHETCEPSNPAESKTNVIGLPVGEVDSPGKSDVPEAPDSTDDIVASCGDNGNNSRAVAHCSNVDVNETIADNQIDVDNEESPEVVAVVGGDSRISLGSAIVWYKEFLNVERWMPEMIFILGSSKDRELIKLTWTVLSTLSYINVDDTFLCSQMAAPELLRVLLVSISEYFGHNTDDDTVCIHNVPECRAALIEWTKIVFSYTFSEDTTKMYSLYKADLMKVIFKMFKVFDNFLPVDTNLLEYLSHTFSILDCLLQIEPLELPILEVGVEETVMLLDTVQAEKISKLNLKECSENEVDALEQGEKFLRNVLQLCNHLESTGSIGVLQETHQRLKERFVKRNES